MSKSRRQVISCVLVVIFALYYANISFFYNSHVINGVTIVHSHFHGKNHEQSDTHSENELKLISVLSFFQSLQATVFRGARGVLPSTGSDYSSNNGSFYSENCCMYHITCTALPIVISTTRHIFTKHAHNDKHRDCLLLCVVLRSLQVNNY